MSLGTTLLPRAQPGSHFVRLPKNICIFHFALVVILQRGTIIFLNAVIRLILVLERKTPETDADEVRTISTVSITQQALLLIPLTTVFNPGNELSNKYSVITTMTCQRQIIWFIIRKSSFIEYLLSDIVIFGIILNYSGPSGNTCLFIEIWPQLIEFVKMENTAATLKPLLSSLTQLNISVQFSEGMKSSYLGRKIKKIQLEK